jgi:hypothetical protein
LVRALEQVPALERAPEMEKALGKAPVSSWVSGPWATAQYCRTTRQAAPRGKRKE